VERIGKYRVERLLGAGSFATVWLAVDELLDDRVAIKVLADNWSRQPDIRRRFIDEAKILRRIDHDRIVRVHQVDELSDGRPYFVMSWADRATLYERLVEAKRRGERFPVAEAVRLTIEIAECLTVVHAFGVIHRDIKPSNVLFRSLAAHQRLVSNRRGGGSLLADEQMMLGDFGLAKNLQGASGFTFAAGTPAYMAPEQARSTAELDARADVFSTTAVFFELLAGRPAFAAETLSGVARAHDRDRGASLPELPPDVPAALRKVIAGGLEPDPANRIPSAADLATAIEDALGGRPSPAPSVIAPAAPDTITARPAASGPPPSDAGPLMTETLALIDEIGRRVAGTAAEMATAMARTRLIRPLRVMVVGQPGAAASRMAFALAGERLAAGPDGWHGQVTVWLVGGQPEGAQLEWADGTRRAGAVLRNPDGSVSLALGATGGGAPPRRVAVTVGGPRLASRWVIDAGGLLADPDVTEAGKTLAEADLLVTLLPADLDAGQALVTELRRRQHVAVVGPVLSVAAVEEGPEAASAARSYAADPQTAAAFSLVVPIEGGQAAVVETMAAVLAAHGEPVRASAALTLAELAVRAGTDAGARSARSVLADGRDALTLQYPALEELSVLRLEATGRLPLPGPYRAELRRVLASGSAEARLGLPSGSPPATRRAAAEMALERWRTFLNTGRAPFASRDAAQAVVRALERLWAQSQG
jgi:hypothetical protein